jgi:hypothetical protein
MVTKRKAQANVNLQVTGRSVAYIQDVAKNGKLGKPKAVVVTTVNAGSPAPSVAPKRRRKPRKK